MFGFGFPPDRRAARAAGGDGARAEGAVRRASRGAGGRARAGRSPGRCCRLRCAPAGRRCGWAAWPTPRWTSRPGWPTGGTAGAWTPRGSRTRAARLHAGGARGRRRPGAGSRWWGRTRPTSTRLLADRADRGLSAGDAWTGTAEELRAFADRLARAGCGWAIFLPGGPADRRGRDRPGPARVNSAELKRAKRACAPRCSPGARRSIPGSGRGAGCLIVERFVRAARRSRAARDGDGVLVVRIGGADGSADRPGWSTPASRWRCPGSWTDDLEPRTWRPGEPVTETHFGAREPARGRWWNRPRSTWSPPRASRSIARAAAWGTAAASTTGSSRSTAALRAAVAFGVQVVDGSPAGGRVRPAGGRDRHRVRDDPGAPSGSGVPCHRVPPGRSRLEQRFKRAV